MHQLLTVAMILIVIYREELNMGPCFGLFNEKPIVLHISPLMTREKPLRSGAPYGLNFFRLVLMLLKICIWVQVLYLIIRLVIILLKKTY